MRAHLFCITVAAFVIVTGLFLPFLPGDYDRLAAPLATMAMTFGYVGFILLVPVGTCWLVYELRKGGSASGAPMHPDKGYYFTLAAVVASALVVATVALAALVTVGAPAAFIWLLAVVVCFVSWIMPGLRRLKSGASKHFNPAPLYLIVLPVVVVLLQFTLGEGAAEFARSRAISNCTPLIADVERYCQEHGRYPTSLESVWEDYKPSVRGIERYRYEPSGETYNVYFETFSFSPGTREFVMYNQRDEQEMTSHNMDLLQIAPAGIRRGYYAVRDAGPPHWKRFFFD